MNPGIEIILFLHFSSFINVRSEIKVFVYRYVIKKNAGQRQWLGIVWDSNPDDSVPETEFVTVTTK